MAARTRRIFHDENTRLKIQATQLIKRLQKHALGEIELTTSQIKAIEVLLRKTLPDLAAQHVTSDTGKTIEDWLDEIDDPEADSTEG